MQYITELEGYVDTARTAITLGKFDGLHKGHQKLVNRVIEYGKEEGVKAIVFAFDMAPLRARLGLPNKGLMTNAERRLRLEGKVDYLMECPFTEEICNMEAETFIKEILVDRFHVKYVVVGTDYRFGHDKRGNIDMLTEYAGRYGYQLEVVEKERFSNRVVSSTFVKEVLSTGNMSLVNVLLGYPYTVAGHVEHGNKIGRKIGSPTMNISISSYKLLPPNGVYVGIIRIDGKWYESICNIGVKPTVESDGRVLLEGHLFDYSGDAYGKEIEVRLLKLKRPEQKFDSVEALKAQIEQDIEYGKQYFRERG